MFLRIWAQINGSYRPLSYLLSKENLGKIDAETLLWGPARSRSVEVEKKNREICREN